MSTIKPTDASVTFVERKGSVKIMIAPSVKEQAEKVVKCISMGSISLSKAIEDLEKKSYHELLIELEENRDLADDGYLLTLFAAEDLVECVRIVLDSKLMRPEANHKSKVAKAQQTREFALSIAAEKSSPAIVELLLQSGPISRGYRGSVLVRAASVNSLEKVQKIIASGPISPHSRGIAIIEALQKNKELNIEIIKAILSQGPLLDGHRNNALAHARTHHHLEVIQLLSQQGSCVIL